MNQEQAQQPQQININPEDTTGVLCTKCQSEFFMPMYMLRKVSAIISPSGREEIIQVPVMVCGNCGKPYMGDAEEEMAAMADGGIGEAQTDGSTIVGG